MKTVEEILRETGLTDEQIKALDPKVLPAFTQVVTTASQAQEAAELAQRAQAQQYDTEISPALVAWANEKAQKDAEIAYYKTQLEGAKAGGFTPTAVPGAPPAPQPPAAASDPSRDPAGRFVAGGNTVPGSPQFVASLRNEVGAALGSMMDVQWKYQSLYGRPLPDSPTELIKEASAQRMDPVAYIAKKYDFAGKEAAQKAEDQKKHDDAIRAEVSAAKDKEWGEKVGSNPELRMAKTSEFSQINKAVKAGTRPDPLKLTEQERDRATQAAIRAEVNAQTVN